MTGRLFPIMALSSYRARDDVFALLKAGATQVVIALPWSLIAPHEEQARSNHGGQTLDRLAERGGLGPDEAVAVLENRRWHRMEPAAAHAALARMLTERVA